MTKNKQQTGKEILEWLPNKRWNPFNSYKLLIHVQRWKQINRGEKIPSPALITVDPTNVCNLNCAWCNAEFVRKQRKTLLSEKILLNIADFLPHWGDNNPDFKSGVDAICIAGGGEPLLNPGTANFIDKVIANGVEIGVVTNGTEISKCVDSLSQCTWVGVSVDAATPGTFNKLKNNSSDSNYIHNITRNIANLVDYAKKHNHRLGFKHPAYGVSYKYLLCKDNIAEIYQAAKLAKEIGCKNIHFRPAGTPWDKTGTNNEVSFSHEDILLFTEQITKALELDDEFFSVYGVTHKFSSQFERANYFANCYAIFMTAVIMPPGSENAPKDSFAFGLCCDRRGDKRLELANNIIDVEEIQKLWGSEKHWRIHDAIKVDNECPRCTYQPHNEIYEQVILNDSMTYKFI